MKHFALAALLAMASAHRLEGIWDDSMAGINQAEYNAEAPKDYKEKDKPKIDYAAIERKKLLAEQAKEKEAERARAREKEVEDMNIELLTFTKTLKPSNFHKALQLKEKMEEEGHPPKHFRVSATSLFQKAFEHEAVAQHKFVKDKLEDLLIAERNLNRNIDSKA